MGMNEKQIKQQIRMLRKLKLSCRSGSKERIDLHRKIKALKEKLEYSKIKDAEKTPIIEQILKFKPYKTNLYKFTVKQLEFHLKRLRGEK